jgi:hypothetical protein
MLEKWQIEEIRTYWEETIGYPVLQQHRTVHSQSEIYNFSAPFIWIIREENGCVQFIITKSSEIQNIIRLSEEKAKLLMEVLEEMYL